MSDNFPHGWFKSQKAFYLTSLEDFGPPPSSHLSIVREHPNCGFKPLNKYQDEAVKEALGNPFTLVQGPPGKHELSPWLTNSSLCIFIFKALFCCFVIIIYIFYWNIRLLKNASGLPLKVYVPICKLSRLVWINNLTSSGLNFVPNSYKSRFFKAHTCTLFLVFIEPATIVVTAFDLTVIIKYNCIDVWCFFIYAFSFYLVKHIYRENPDQGTGQQSLAHLMLNKLSYLSLCHTSE